MIRTLIRYTDNKVFTNDSEIFEANPRLNPGIYDIELDQYGKFSNFCFRDVPKVFDFMPSDELDNLLYYTHKFLSEEHSIFSKEAGILNKTSILLHGKQGIGKSNFVNYVIEKAIKENKACAFVINGYSTLKAFIQISKQLRLIQDNLFLVIFEEMDSLFSSYENCEPSIKNLMDGTDSIDNMLILGTTNYIEKIPNSLIDRPSRFKKVIEIKQSDNLTNVKLWLRNVYKNISKKLTEEDFDKLDTLCINKTVDEIKHTVIDYCLNITSIQAKNKIGFK